MNHKYKKSFEELVQENKQELLIFKNKQILEKIENRIEKHNKFATKKLVRQ